SACTYAENLRRLPRAYSALKLCSSAPNPLSTPARQRTARATFQKQESRRPTLLGHHCMMCLPSHCHCHATWPPNGLFARQTSCTRKRLLSQGTDSSRTQRRVLRQWLSAQHRDDQKQVHGQTLERARYSTGVWPVQRLNARWKALSSEKPSSAAISL